MVQGIELTAHIVNAIVCTTSAAMLWWFGDRAMQLKKSCAHPTDNCAPDRASNHPLTQLPALTTAGTIQRHGGRHA